jgi:Restriction Endonuclease associating with ARP
VSLSFKEKAIKSLELYKKEKLGINELGIFKYRGQELLKNHILPTEFKTHNIIEFYRDSFYSSSNSQIDFHKYYHHLNSSQALCINLFFPLIAEGQLSLVLDLLNIPRQATVEASFEKESDVEVGGGRKTNFDFYLHLSNNFKVYFEIKYTESEFGKAKNDNEHRDKYVKTYLPLLKNNDYINPEFSDVNNFLDSYQIMRNLSHINEDSFVVFVYPEANKKIHLQAQSAQENILTHMSLNAVNRHKGIIKKK